MRDVMSLYNDLVRKQAQLMWLLVNLLKKLVNAEDQYVKADSMRFPSMIFFILNGKNRMELKNNGSRNSCY